MSEMRFERRMSDQDALMWAIEKDPLLRSTITTVSILEASPDRERFEDQLDRATRTVPRLRQRVVSAPLSAAPPRYVIDENFDLAYHVRWLRAPGDGSLRALLDMAAPLAMQGFDRARPLWEFDIVEGLAEGRAALVSKIHHSITDGVGAMKLTMSFLDTKRDRARDTSPLPIPPDPERLSPLALWREALEHETRRQTGIAQRLGGEVVRAARDPLGTARATVEGARSTAHMLRPVTTPLSPIMGKRSLSVHFDTLTASLPRMKAAAKSVDGRLNDAFVAAVVGGLDRYHQRHDAPVEALRMTMPINVRTADQAMEAGNQFVPARFPVPLGIADPRERMRRLTSLVASERAEPALGMVAPIAGVLNRLPVSVTTRLFGGMLKGIDFVTSNVPGAPIPIYVAGARLEANFAFGPLSGSAMNITLLSYIDELHMGVNTDRAAVPDPDVLLECLQDGIDEVEKLG
jgi:diacylglycerol O-acyltransferase / wax synthase